MPSIEKDLLDPVVLDIAVRRAKEKENKHELKARLVKQENELHTCKLVCVNKMKVAADKIDKVEERLIEGNLSEHKANELSNKYKQERIALNNEIKVYEEQIRTINEQIETLLEQEEIDYTKLTEQEQYDLVHKFIRRVDLIRPAIMTMRIVVYDIFGKAYSYDYYTRKADKNFGCKLLFEGYDYVPDEIKQQPFYYKHPDL